MFNFNVDNADKVKEFVPYAIIVGGCFGVAELIKAFSGLPEVIVLKFFVLTVIAIGAWMCLHFLSRTDDSVWADTNEAIKGIDKLAQTRIYEGIQDVKFIEEFASNEDEMLRRWKINDIALGALTPSIYHNQHCRGLKEAETSGRISYLQSKQKQVHKAFNKNSERRRYLTMVTNRIPPGQTLDDLVKAYIYSLFKDVVAPILVSACESKVRVYENILGNKNVSNRFKRSTQEKLKKNKEYLVLLRSLMEDDSVVEGADSHPRVSSIGTVSSVVTDAPPDTTSSSQQRPVVQTNEDS